jgi:hypothetical protein
MIKFWSVPGVLSVNLIALIASATLAVYAQVPEGWTEFTSPSKDFHVLLPAKLHKKVENVMGQKAIMYQQLDPDGTAYALADGIYVNPAKKPKSHADVITNLAAAAEAKFMQSVATPVTKESTDLNGKGWHGRKIVFKTENHVLLTVLIAISNSDDVAYALYANAGEDKPNVAAFMNSFQVDPELASKSHMDLSRSAGVNGFVNVIWTISLAALVAAGVAIIVSIIRNRAPSSPAKAGRADHSGEAD